MRSVRLRGVEDRRLRRGVGEGLADGDGCPKRGVVSVHVF